MTTKIDEALMRCDVDKSNLEVFCSIRDTLRKYHFNPELIADLDAALDGQNPTIQDYSSYSDSDISRAKPLIDDLCSVILSQNRYPSTKYLQLSELFKKIANEAIVENNPFVIDFSQLYLELKDECIEKENEITNDMVDDLSHYRQQNEQSTSDEIVSSALNSENISDADGKNSPSTSKFMQDEIKIAKRQKAIFFKELQNKLDEAFKELYIAEDIIQNPNININDKKAAVGNVHRIDHELGVTFTNARHNLTNNVMIDLRQKNRAIGYDYDFCDRLVQYVMFDVSLLASVEKYKKESGKLYNDFKNQNITNNPQDDFLHHNHPENQHKSNEQVELDVNKDNDDDNYNMSYDNSPSI